MRDQENQANKRYREDDESPEPARSALLSAKDAVDKFLCLAAERVTVAEAQLKQVEREMGNARREYRLLGAAAAAFREDDDEDAHMDSKGY